VQFLRSTLKARTGLQALHGRRCHTTQQSHNEKCKHRVEQTVALLIRSLCHRQMVLCAAGSAIASAHITPFVQALVSFWVAIW
jgi:hypothetical protein